MNDLEWPWMAVLRSGIARYLCGSRASCYIFIYVCRLTWSTKPPSVVRYGCGKVTKIPAVAFMPNTVRFPPSKWFSASTSHHIHRCFERPVRACGRNTQCLTLTPPIPLRLYTLPYWSNPSFLISDTRALWRSGLSAKAPECQKLKMVD